MKFFGKNDKQQDDNSKVHVRTVLSTKPGHKVLRRERCECDHGAARGGCMTYDNPDA